MILRPGLRVVATLSDATTMAGTTAWSWRTLRLRDARPLTSDGVTGRFLIPMTAVLAVQIL